MGALRAELGTTLSPATEGLGGDLLGLGFIPEGTVSHAGSTGS